MRKGDNMPVVRTAIRNDDGSVIGNLAQWRDDMPVNQRITNNDDGSVTGETMQTPDWPRINPYGLGLDEFITTERPEDAPPMTVESLNEVLRDINPWTNAPVRGPAVQPATGRPPGDFPRVVNTEAPRPSLDVRSLDVCYFAGMAEGSGGAMGEVQSHPGEYFVRLERDGTEMSVGLNDDNRLRCALALAPELVVALRLYRDAMGTMRGDHLDEYSVEIVSALFSAMDAELRPVFDIIGQ
jgi:hypothetical protein